MSDLVLLCAKTEMEDGPDKISIFLVEGDRPGFTRGKNLDKVGRDAQDTSELFFEDVRLPMSNVLGGVPAAILASPGTIWKHPFSHFFTSFFPFLRHFREFIKP